jgi:5'-nucleotidase
VFSENEKLNKSIKPYHIFDEYQVAVIGVTTETTPSISKPDPSTRFTDAVQAVQDTVDHIRATTNITRIVALTHIGYAEDQALARNTTGVSLIIGGHSHTLLGDMPNAEGKYPTIVENLDGDEVFVVTAWRWDEYLGYIDVAWDAEGRILEYHGGPIFLSNKTAQDPGLQAKINAWREPFDAFGKEVVGFTTMVLDQTACQQRECLMGNVITE